MLLTNSVHKIKFPSSKKQSTTFSELDKLVNKFKTLTIAGYKTVLNVKNLDNGCMRVALEVFQY